MKNYRLKIFCEFRITLSDSDDILNFLKKFIPDKKQPKVSVIEANYAEGSISTHEYFLSIFEMVKDLTQEKVYLESGKMKTDNSFKDFVSYCKENDHELIILSDFFESYIRNVFRQNDIDVKFY